MRIGHTMRNGWTVVAINEAVGIIVAMNPDNHLAPYVCWKLDKDNHTYAGIYSMHLSKVVDAFYNRITVKW